MKHIVDATVLALVLALGAVAYTVSSCAHVESVAKKTMDCAEPKIAERAKQLAPMVFDKLCKPTDDWSKELDLLVMSAGDVGICAVRAVIEELQSKPTMPEAWQTSYLSKDTAATLQLARAQVWLAKNGF